MTETISTLVDAGNASAGPPLGPALGPLPVDIGEVVNEINQRTEDFEGMEIPVDVIIDEETGDFEIEVGTPPVAALVKDKADIDGGSGAPNEVKVANMAMKDVIAIAEMKQPDLVALDLPGATKEVLGSMQSMGVLVDGKEPMEVQQEVDDGEYDAVFAGEEELPDEPKGGEIDAEEAQRQLEERLEEEEAEAEEDEDGEEDEGDADEETAEDEAADEEDEA